MTSSSSPETGMGKLKLSTHLTSAFKLNQHTSIKGIGEDAAVLNSDAGYSLISQTILIENVHFDLVYCPLQHIGYKAVVVGIADILSMNGLAQQITLHVAFSNKFSLKALETLYSGVHIACQHYQLDLVGHDITPSITGLLITVTTIGKVASTKVIYREGAKPYDLVCVTGDLGAAYLGLQILIREKKIFEADATMQPQLAPYQYLIGRQLKPTPRVDIIKLLGDLQITPSSMINVKDGLGAALLHIGKQSQVGMAIYENKLPIDQQTYEVSDMFGLSSTVCALHGGEDYELLFTLSQSEFPLIENNIHIHPIGYVTEASHGIKLITTANDLIDITAQGWSEVQKHS